MRSERHQPPAVRTFSGRPPILRARSSPTNVGAPAFVGRDRELADVRAALRIPGSVTLIAGEPGIGKSRLVWEAIAGRRERDGNLLYATCPPLRTPLTLGPIVAGLRAECLDGAALSHDPLAGALRPLFPEWADHLPPALDPLDDPQASRQRLFAALRRVFEICDVTHLVVDDLHWADETTLEFLLDVTSHPGGPGLVATYRPDDVPPTSLLRRLTSRPRAGQVRRQLDLAPLAVEDTAAMVSSMVGGAPVSGELVRTLQQRSEGLPLAIEETMQLLRGKAALARTDGVWSAVGLTDVGVPPMLRDAFLERAHALGPPALAILRSTAVLAEDATADLVLRVTGLSADVGLDALQACLESGLLVEDDHGWLGYRHVLAAEAIHDSIPHYAQRRLHLAVAHELESVTPLPLARLVHHFSVAGDTQAWATYAERLADTAIASGDDVRGITMLADLVDHPDIEHAARLRLATKLADTGVFRRHVDGDLLHRVRRSLDRVTAFTDVPASERALLLARLGPLLMQMGDYEDGRALLLEALPDLADDSAIVRTVVYLAMPYGSTDPARAHLNWLRRAASLRPVGLTPRQELSQRVGLMTCMLLLGEEAGWEIADALPLGSEDLPAPVEVVVGHCNAATTAVLWGRYTDARRHLEAGLRIADEVHAARVHGPLRGTEGLLDWLTGRWEGLAERMQPLSGALAEGSTPLEATIVLGMMAAQQERPGAEDGLRGALTELGRHGLAHSDLAAHAAAALAELYLHDDRVDDALLVTEELVDVIHGRELWIWGSQILPVRVIALLRAGAPGDAAALVDRFAGGLGSLAAPAAQVALLHCRALVADEKDRHPQLMSYAWAQVAQWWSALPAPRYVALAHARQAEALVRAGQRDEAVGAFAAARAVFAELGAARDAGELEARMRERGLTMPAPRPAGRRGYGDDLSPRELEVVRLLVGGRTNREIGALLVLSPKTVARHLESARRKLHVGSRTALVVKALELGIVPEPETGATPPPS